MFYDVGSLLGVIALITIVVNLLKLTGLIKDGGAVANLVQTVVSILLTLVGVFFPDWLNFLPMVDHAAEVLAKIIQESYAFILLIIPLFKEFGNIFHDAFAQIPFLNKFIGYRLTAD